MKAAPQLEFKGTKGHGGRRRGAGRPRGATRVNHLKRVRINANIPVHITMRLRPLAVSLRSKRLFNAFKIAAAGARHFGLRINEFCLMGNHLHFIAEAADNAALARGMRSFGGRLGKLIRAAAGARGSVFNGRFHLHALRTPTEYKRALAYVLLNHSKHAGGPPKIDPYSSAPHFTEWIRVVARAHVARLVRIGATARADYLSAARSWMGRTGWQRAEIRFA